MRIKFESSTRNFVYVFALSIMILLFSSPLFAETFSISQSGSTSCGGTYLHSVSWFISSSNWGSGAGQVNGGDTVYLCGTITSDMTIPGSGASAGTVVTIDGTNATLNSHISMTGKSL